MKAALSEVQGEFQQYRTRVHSVLKQQQEARDRADDGLVAEDKAVVSRLEKEMATLRLDLSESHCVHRLGA